MFSKISTYILKMPPVDLGGNDRKIACETLADGEQGGDSRKNEPMSGEGDADFPPESFWLSKEAEYDWFDRNAFFERKDSGKGHSSAANLNNPNSNHSSQRFPVNLKSKASIIGLPKMQKNTFVDANRRTCKSVNIRLFPKRSGSAGKSTVAVAEPGSPKVSCMGRVRSKRSRRRSSSSKSNEKSLEKSKIAREKAKPSGDKPNKVGFCSKVMRMFRGKKSNKKWDRTDSRRVVEAPAEEPPAQEQHRKSVSLTSVSEPPSLGGMKRFTSGRRSGSWSTDDFGQVDLDRREGRN